MMSELNTQFPGILLGYVSNVGYHLSSDECNELTKLWSHNEYNYDQLKAENERLKTALQEIKNFTLEERADYEMSDAAYSMRDVADEALKR
jgi:hypothetical protein